MKLKVQKILFLFLILAFSSICQAQDFASAKQTIDDFLHNWLVTKNIKSIEKDFSQKLFTSKFLLDDSCLDVKITDDERKSPQKLKQKTIEFLQDIADKAQGNSLEEILTLNSSQDYFGFEENQLLSSLKENKYQVAKIVGAVEDSYKDDFDSFKSKFPSSDGYLIIGVLIKYKTADNYKFDLPVYIMWAKQKGSWKVIQFGVPCQ